MMTAGIELLTVSLKLPVEVIGCGVDGREFLERTHTLAIDPEGATVALRSKLAPQSEVIVRNPGTNQGALASVVEQIRSERDWRIYNIAFLNPTADIWHVRFPSVPPITKPEQRDGLTRGATAEVLRESHGTLERDATEETASCSLLSPAHRRERRLQKRTTVKLLACIRYAGIEETARCENLSKAGFRFISRRELPAGTRLEAAVPYTKGSTNLFANAQIVFCRPLPDGGFQHGAAYIGTRSTDVWAEARYRD
jgi:hypothetical protein